ncbi:MAG: hypothetical protein ACXADW_17605 [Candidatus Hodarchaeales archaeon]|jgi:hypothetical protein
MQGIRKNKRGLIIIGIGLCSILVPSFLTPIIFPLDNPETENSPNDNLFYEEPKPIYGNDDPNPMDPGPIKDDGGGGKDEDPGSKDDGGGGKDEDPDPKDEIISATLEFCPKTLNRKSKGKWVTIYISLQEGYDVNDIVLEDILLNGLSRAESSPTDIFYYDDDLFLDLMVKFDRQAVIGLFELEGNEEITITGNLEDDTEFQGSCTIRVI